MARLIVLVVDRLSCYKLNDDSQKCLVFPNDILEAFKWDVQRKCILLMTLPLKALKIMMEKILILKEEKKIDKNQERQ